ncbi:PhzF family phenazine biosynthesis protein [Streptomyces roseirectus]|uniref:PhzF family phenazine biosynthesis protein n=1 Tax=Streptomyces roseirectus TaxID=2768066 RepID=A0A7H0I6B8_9ACTN|nr:PhzF family phenazine biosynthesis protein [Streptomyces roseirectus]QNP68334.1 PhzF family phenazine biosynthesis protein [Streptomyces roseirectus]
MTDVHVLRVFTDADGRFGNPLGVLLGAADWAADERQELAARLGYSETVFVDDASTGRLQIFTPACELAFAGHPLVGVGALLARTTGRPPRELRPVRLAEPVPARTDHDGTVWVRGAVADAPPWEHERLAGPAEVEGLVPPPLGRSPSAGEDKRWRRTQTWAWQDEAAGEVRARVFAADYGVVEDEACGSASLLLSAYLSRELTIRHGRGSVVRARPLGTDHAEIGGRVVHDGVRQVARMPRP